MFITTIKRFTLAMLATIAMGQAQAGVLLSETTNITGTNAYAITQFTVTDPGTFSIYTMGPTIDAYIELFSATGFFSDSNILGEADDNCSFEICGPAGSFANGIITLNLALGDYIAVAGDCCGSIRDFPNRNRGSRSDFLTVVVASEDGAIQNNVPEPTTVALVGLGLLGFAASRRKSAQNKNA